MTSPAPGADMARLLMEAGTIQVSRDRPFVLAAGWASPVYVDCRRLIGDPRIRRATTDLAADFLRSRFGAALPFDAVAGGETAGIPWASWIADQLGLPLRYVRKRPLGIGRNAQVEGGPVDGQRVLLIDDLVTDAASKEAFTRGLRLAGATVTDVLVIFQNGVFPGGAERLARLGLTLHALAGWDDVLRLDPGATPLDPGGTQLGPGGTPLGIEGRAEIERFLRDPAGWSAAHDGRAAEMRLPLIE